MDKIEEEDNVLSITQDKKAKMRWMLDDGVGVNFIEFVRRIRSGRSVRGLES
jgi:hypothetical protein